MKAIILAAGASTRLMPLTKNTPKCLLPIRNNKAIIDYQVEALLENKVSKICIVIGFNGNKIKNHLAARYNNKLFKFIENPDYKITNAIYSLWLARNELKGDLIYLNSDLLFDKRMLEALITSNKKTVVAFQKTKTDEEAGKLNVNNTLRVLEMGKHLDHKTCSGEYMQIGKFSASFNKNLVHVMDEKIKNKEYNYFTIDVFNETIKKYKNNVFGVDATHLPAIEVDYPKDLARAKREIAPKLI